MKTTCIITFHDGSTLSYAKRPNLIASPWTIPSDTREAIAARLFGGAGDRCSWSFDKDELTCPEERVFVGVFHVDCEDHDVDTYTDARGIRVTRSVPNGKRASFTLTVTSDHR